MLGPGPAGPHIALSADASPTLGNRAAAPWEYIVDWFSSGGTFLNSGGRRGSQGEEGGLQAKKIRKHWWECRQLTVVIVPELEGMVQLDYR